MIGCMGLVLLAIAPLAVCHRTAGRGLAGRARVLCLPIAGGENHTTRRDPQSLVEAQAAPIRQPDVMRGGFIELRQIVVRVEPWGSRIAPHRFPELMAHPVCAIPNGLILEYMGWTNDLPVDPPLPPQKMLSPPEAPGPGWCSNPRCWPTIAYRKPPEPE